MIIYDIFISELNIKLNYNIYIVLYSNVITSILEDELNSFMCSITLKFELVNCMQNLVVTYDCVLLVIIDTHIKVFYMFYTLLQLNII